MADDNSHKRLGRGLAALLGDVDTDVEAVERARSQRRVPIEFVTANPNNPRRSFNADELEDLTRSVREKGIVQPILVRPQPAIPLEENRYEIIAGERRWRACQMAGLNSIPVVIKDVPDEAAIAMALIENIQRENLNPMEEAIALQRLQQEFELTQQEVADAVGKSRSTVTNLLRLMNLCGDVRKMLEYGDLEMGHARALLPLDEEMQINAAREVSGKGLSVRQTEDLVRKLQSDVPNDPEKKSEPDVQLESWANNLSRKLATKVSISANAKGKGKITIAYESKESLEAILENLQ